jgi:hypothetical protein
MTIFKATDMVSGTLGKMSSNIGTFQAKARAAFMGIVPGGKFLGSIAGQVAIGTLAVKGLTAAANGLKNTISSIPQFAANADAIGKQSQILGLGAEQLQRYQYAAKMSNVPQERLAASFQLLNRSIGSGALFTSLEKIDGGLAFQVKQAKSTSEAFMTMSEAISRETNVAKRAAMVNAAFGKSGAALIPMMQGGAEAMREMMEAAPNIISSRTIAIATIFGNTMTHIKEVIQSFTDTARAGVLEAITPYILAAKDWLDVNREFIKVKIQQFIQKTSALIQRLIPTFVKIYTGAKNFIAMIKPFVSWAMDNLPKIIPVVAGIAGAFMLLDGVMSIVKGITGAISLLTSPMGLIVLAVAALVAGFIILAMKVGGFKEALIVAGQTIMKFLLSPLNLVLDAVQGLFWMMSKLPGADWAKTAYEGIKAFQDEWNTKLTGSESTIGIRSGIAGAMAGYESGGALGAVGGLYAGGYGAALDPYKNARAEFLEKQKEAGDDSESLTKTITDKFNEMIKAQMGTTSAVEGLADDGGPNSPAALRWGKMGQEDYWEIQRLGI